MAANLKKLVSTCDFGTFLSDALRDRFACGLRSETKLLDHAFQEALNVALKHEAAEKDVVELNPKSADTTANHLLYVEKIRRI